MLRSAAHAINVTTSFVARHPKGIGSTPLRNNVANGFRCTNYSFGLRFNSSSPGDDDFRPRRLMSKEYRLSSSSERKKAKKKMKTIDIDEEDELEFEESLRQQRRDRARGRAPDAEYNLRMMDYLTADEGSTEERMLERRILAESFDTPEEAKNFVEELHKDMKELEIENLQLGHHDPSPDGEDDDEEEEKIDIDPRCQIPARHDWSETVVRMDRVQKVQRGGTMLRYRCLVIGGNGKGVAGFGVGKALEPKEAAEVASRICKRNIFFIDAYQNSGITSDLVGKHNSCIVRLRAQPSYLGLRGHPLICDILLYFGITDVSAKSHGNRNIYNVVYATFKAIMNHQSLEEISRARGKRYLTLDKARRLDMNSN